MAITYLQLYCREQVGGVAERQDAGPGLWAGQGKAKPSPRWKLTAGLERPEEVRQPSGSLQGLTMG